MKYQPRFKRMERGQQTIVVPKGSIVPTPIKHREKKKKKKSEVREDERGGV